MYYSNNKDILVILVIIAGTVLVRMYIHMWLVTLHTLRIIVQNFVATTNNNQDCSVSSFLLAILSYAASCLVQHPIWNQCSAPVSS